MKHRAPIAITAPERPISPPQLPVLSATAPLAGIPTRALKIGQLFHPSKQEYFEHLPKRETYAGDTKLETEIGHLAIYQGDNTR